MLFLYELVLSSSGVTGRLISFENSGFGDLQQRYTSYYAYSEIMCAYAYDEYYA